MKISHLFIATAETFLYNSKTDWKYGAGAHHGRGSRFAKEESA